MVSTGMEVRTTGKCYLGCQLGIGAKGKMKLFPHALFDGLARPVQILGADLNGDHKEDYIICEFGNITGRLIWMENRGNNEFTRHIISNLPGSIKMYLDATGSKNGPDIWVLFTQGQEKISRFINRGNGVFEETTILAFPPIYGSSIFELVDIDHDGYKDIVYTCGDNGNATAVLKPYHGVYIFKNDGHEHFQQKYFYPINGCYKALARDYDSDGNTDIATIGLYTDARQPEEGFIYLHNSGNFHFKSYALPKEIKFERAVTMDAGILHKGGKQDIVLGNAFFDFGPFAYQKQETLFYLLKNNTK
jgi:hypothetical protein